MLTPRLKCIAEHIAGEKAADIGTDHAYIPIKLVKDGKIKYAVAADIKEGPVEIAKNNVKKYGLEDKIDVRLGAGLSVLKKGEVDIIVIAGMGGILIRDIIDKDEDKARSSNLILQPMNCQYELRKYLIENGYSISEEDIAVEGFKVYNIMKVKSGNQERFKRDIDYHIPPYLYNHKYFKELYAKKEREFLKVIKGLENSKEIDYEKLEKYKFWLDELYGIGI